MEYLPFIGTLHILILTFPNNPAEVFLYLDVEKVTQLSARI